MQCYEGQNFYTIVKEKTGEWKKGFARCTCYQKMVNPVITDTDFTDLDYLTNLQEL